MTKPWETEPDRKEFTAHGLRCVIKRHPTMKHLCGYVEVPKGHRWETLDALDIPADVHGGITYSEKSLPGEESKADNWWIGFDCSHAGDLVPDSVLPHMSDEAYRDIKYVERECRELARQVRECADE